MNYLLGFISGIWLIIFILFIINDYDIRETKQKPTIDYKLKGNNKQIDTIWIYNFKKH